MNKRFYLKDINPLAGLTEYRLASFLSQAQRGSYAEVQWLYSFIERRNPAVRAVKRRLLSALGKLDWDIKISDSIDEEDAEKLARAEAQAQTLRAAYDKIRNLRQALTFLSLADLRGYSHLEKMYRGNVEAPLAEGISAWDVIELRPVEQWFWVRDGIYGQWEYNGEARAGVYHGASVDLAKFIVREVDDPACEIFAKMHVRQEANDSDWDGYLKRFGIPSVIVEGPPNVPPEKEKEYQTLAEGVANDASGYIPNGAKVHTVAPGSGSSVFKERLEFLDSSIVIAGTSGKLTILSESGSGTLAGGAQKDAFDDIAEALALQVSETMQEGFDRPLLERAFPGEEILAYFAFEAVSEDDGGKALEDAGKAFAAGYQIDDAELSEKSGYQLTRLPQPAAAPGGFRQDGQDVRDGQDVGTKPEVIAAPAVVEKEADVAPSQEQAAAAVEKTLRLTPGFVAPAKSVIDELIEAGSDGVMSDAEFLAFAERMIAEIPALADKADVAGVADALEAAMRTAVETTLQG